MLPAGILAFMLPVEPEEGFYADPPIQRWARKAACHGSNLIIRTLGYSYNAYVLIFD